MNLTSLTRQQLIALRDPCFYAEETVKRKFFHVPFDGISVGLTMNIGME